MPETWPRKAPEDHRSPVLAPKHRPNPCSELYPNPFSDSFKANFGEFTFQRLSGKSGLAPYWRVQSAAEMGKRVSLGSFLGLKTRALDALDYFPDSLWKGYSPKFGEGTRPARSYRGGIHSKSGLGA